MTLLGRLPAAFKATGLTAALLLLFSLTFWAPIFWVSILIQALLFAIFAMSLDLLLGYAGMASMGHAAFYGTGALACPLTVTVNVPVPTGVLEGRTALI